MTRETILLALDRLHPGGYEGLDPAQPTPTTYAEYVAALLPGETAHSEAGMLAAAAEQAEIEAAIASAPTPESRLADLSAEFHRLPSEIQFAFAADFAIVRTLVLAGESGLAAGHVAKLIIPEELEPTREAILAALS